MLIYAVILAAGSSSRLGFNKLLVKIDGEAVIRRSVKPFLRRDIAKVFVVTGDMQEPIRRALQGLPVEYIRNERSMNGMSASVRASIPFIKKAEGVFFHLADKPFVDGDIIDRIINAFSGGSAPVIVPVFNEAKGHPVLLDVRRYSDEMVFLEGDRGLREIIEKYSKDVLCIEGNEGNIFDIDTMDEINILTRRGYRVEKG